MWNFELLSMSFWRDNHVVKLVGVNAPSAPRLAIAEVLAYMNLLLQEFADLFRMPTDLPPARTFDHRIHLLTATALVAARP